MSLRKTKIVTEEEQSDLRERTLRVEVQKLKQELDRAHAQMARVADSHVRHLAAKSPIKMQPAAKVQRKGEWVRVIVPDTHGSAGSAKAIAAMLADVKRLNPDEVILLGDHVDCGGHLAEHHVLGYVAQSHYTYEQDIAATNAFLDALQAAAPKAVFHYLEGNHERRVETWCLTKTLRSSRDGEYLRKMYAPEFLLRLKDRGIPYYRQSEFYMGLSVPGAIRLGKCFFWHGTSTAKDAARVNIAQIGNNIVFGHTHRAQSDQARPVDKGGIGGWNPGCLCELQPLWKHTSPTSWTHGYGVQVVAASGRFLHLNIPIMKGESLFHQFLQRA